MNLAETYIHQVRNGEITVCRYARLAVERHCKMLDNSEKLGIYFDEDAAQDALDFISILKHTQGREYAGKPFNLQPWQAFIIWVIFGWKVKETGFRLISKSYVEVPKKNGKTELAAAIAVYMFFMDGEFGANVYICATARKQADLCFSAAKMMVNFLRRDSEYAAKVIQEPQRWNIHAKATNSKMEPLTKESLTEEGINAHCAIADELHAHPDSSVVDNVGSSMAARAQPLLFQITTAGFNTESFCYKLRKAMVDILEERSEDLSTFAIIFTLDKDDDWKEEKNWPKANPNFGISVNAKFIKDAATEAKNVGLIKQRLFLARHMNKWQSGSEGGWIDEDDWNKCAGAIDEEILKTRKVYCGLDMAATSDIAAFARFYPANLPGEKHYLKLSYYLPGDNIYEKSRNDKTSYEEWANDGWLTLTPGNVIDYNRIKEDIISDVETSDIQRIGYDRWNAYGLVSDLVENGIQMEPYGMGYKSMSFPMKSFHEWVKKCEILHGGDPVLRWMQSNVVVATDGENIKPDRRRSTGKIDGIVASIIAIGQYFIATAEDETTDVDDIIR